MEGRCAPNRALKPGPEASYAPLHMMPSAMTAELHGQAGSSIIEHWRWLKFVYRLDAQSTE